MSEIAFGIFDHLERRDEPLDRLYEERLQMVAAAETAGFFCYHVAEHHATPLGLAPSPGIFLSAVAARTQRIHMGPLVFLLPLYNPLRLVQEICMLDQIRSVEAGWNSASAAAFRPSNSPIIGCRSWKRARCSRRR